MPAIGHGSTALDQSTVAHVFLLLRGWSLTDGLVDLSLNEVDSVSVLKMDPNRLRGVARRHLDLRRGADGSSVESC